MHDHVHIRPMPCFPPFVLSSERRVAGERERDFPLSATGSPDSIPISMYLLKVQTTVAEMLTNYIHYNALALDPNKATYSG